MEERPKAMGSIVVTPHTLNRHGKKFEKIEVVRWDSLRELRIGSMKFRDDMVKKAVVVGKIEVAKRREVLLNYMLFLRVTPTLPNTLINRASPIVDVPYHIFLLGTVVGVIPATYVTVRAFSIF